MSTMTCGKTGHMHLAHGQLRHLRHVMAMVHVPWKPYLSPFPLQLHLSTLAFTSPPSARHPALSPRLGRLVLTYSLPPFLLDLV